MFTLVPVIDLLAGQVVRAVRGERARYRPIESALCGSSSALQVAPVLLEYTASPWLYVADLDALLGRPAQVALLRSLRASLPPGVTLWLDAGFTSRGAAQATLAALGENDTSQVQPVFGSETLHDPRACFAGGAPGVLSLDRRGRQPLDAAGCWQQPALWPQDVIVMTLDQVGAAQGPDLDTLAWVRERAAPGTRVFGAGGLRHEADVQACAAAGAAGWLVASALHDRTLPPHGG